LAAPLVSSRARWLWRPPTLNIEGSHRSLPSGRCLRRPRWWRPRPADEGGGQGRRTLETPYARRRGCHRSCASELRLRQRELGGVCRRMVEEMLARRGGAQREQWRCGCLRWNGSGSREVAEWAQVNEATTTRLSQGHGEQRPAVSASGAQCWTPEDWPAWGKEEQGRPNLGLHVPDLGLWSWGPGVEWRLPGVGDGHCGWSPGPAGGGWWWLLPFG
jgi:hypothetical protein